MIERPIMLTVDAIIEINGGIVLVERKYPPLGWAIPGAFVDPGESLLEAVKRKALENIAFYHASILKQFFHWRKTSMRPVIDF